MKAYVEADAALRTLKSTERFSDRAFDYAVGRPSYPAEAIDALFEGLGDPATLTVVDLGAGTGISARLLAARGTATIAVEPNAEMRAKAVPDARVTWQPGTAERTGLPDACADLVTAFQAFHWFDPAVALAEIARILRPGGRAALVYNERDARDPFTADYGAIVRRYQTDETERRRSDGRDAFAAFVTCDAWRGVRTIEIPNLQRVDVGGLHARAASTSYLPKEGVAAHALRAELDALFTRYERAGTVTMQMQTIVLLADFSPQHIEQDACEKRDAPARRQRPLG